MIYIDNPSSPHVQAIFLKGALRLMSVGLSHSRMTKTEALTIATTLTGNKYKRGQYVEAIQDLQTIIDKGRE
tara:strand:+ start:1637 stop:1852 length:216 start_codon:yes stop_codon:yes gene_type:complete